MPTHKATVTICNRLGLHARPAMSFVELASLYSAKVTVRRESQQVDGKSIMQMMMLAATQGTEIEIVCDGEDAQAALDDLVALVKSQFEEE